MEGIKTKILKLDQGGEYMWRKFIKFCQEAGTRQLIQAYMPHHNIIVKRKNKRLLKKHGVWCWHVIFWVICGQKLITLPRTCWTNALIERTM
jgi:hypothetical protein